MYCVQEEEKDKSEGQQSVMLRSRYKCIVAKLFTLSSQTFYGKDHLED